MRVPVLPIVGLFAGCSLVLGLLVARGFVLREHARIMLGALAVGWLIGAAWTLATAAERAGGLRRVGAGNALLILAATLAAAFAPAAILMLWVAGR